VVILGREILSPQYFLLGDFIMAEYKGFKSRKDYFAERLVRGYSNDLFTYDEAHEKLLSTGTTKAVATRKLNKINKDRESEVKILEERIQDSLPSEVELRED
tara:strand:- start:1054 stop:1359 length:306 start_codon:yes stop_codon:yes gene_type:complete